VRFNFDEDQFMFQSSVRDFLSAECTPEALRGLWSEETGRSAQRWSKLAEIGLLGILIPEPYGGLGMTEIDFALPLEETGRAALPEPIVECAVLAARLLAEVGDDTLASKWLPLIASGEAIVTVGHPINPTVADAHLADLIILEHDGALHAVPRTDVELTAQPASDVARKLFTVDWRPAAATKIADGSDARRLLDRLLDRGAFATAAQSLGIAQQLVDVAVAYSKERHQFGKAIGSFQALKHHLASVQVKIEFARPCVHRAAFSIANDAPTRATDVSQAKTMACEAAVAAAKTALQVHGAIGYTWEVDLHMWMKRAWALEAAWGSRAWHRRRIGAALFDRNAAPPTFGFEGRP
jgi:alkylation response protein AidB-like acyl-CoA dehydrogenase